MNHTDEGTGPFCVDGHSGTYEVGRERERERVVVARTTKKRKSALGAGATDTMHVVMNHTGGTIFIKR